MFTSLYGELAFQHDSVDNDNLKESLETVKMITQSMKMFLLQFDQINKSTDIDNGQSTKTLTDFFKLLSVLNKHLDGLIDQSIEAKYDNISRNNNKKKNFKQSKQNLSCFEKKVLDQINSMSCLFTWNLPTSKKDIILHIKKKYGDLNLNISLPEFKFERYISHIIISYELFCKGKEDLAKKEIILIGKWLEELDKSNDEFYLSISDGLKYVVTSTFVHMEFKTNMTKNIEWFENMIEFSGMNSKSKSTVHAIQAAVLIEYGNDKDCLKKADECVKIACDLDSRISYWFYLHSLILTAQRYLFLSHKSYATDYEKNAIQQALVLSDVQNVYFMYHELVLFKDTVLYNFHQSKNNKVLKHDTQEIISMIKKIVGIEPNDPLIVVKCARILMTLPESVDNMFNFNLGKQYLFKVLKMAPNDLTVLNAIAETIIFSKKNIENINSTSRSTIIIQTNFGEELKLAIEKHNKGEDPVPFLLSLLSKYNNSMQWKILAQVCSYNVLFNDNLEDGVKYFMLLVEAVENELAYDDLILGHYSSFVNKPKKFNLAELIKNEISLALKKDDTPHDKQYYYNILAKIFLVFDIDNDDHVDESMKLNLITGEFGNTNVSSENGRSNRNSNKTKRPRRRKSRNSRNNQNSSVHIIENDELNSDDDDNNNCCRIM